LVSPLLLLLLQEPDLHLPIFHTHRQQMLLHCADCTSARKRC
jgi:hypothetical protein